MYRTSNYVTSRYTISGQLNPGIDLIDLIEVNAKWASFKLHNTFLWANDDAHVVLDQHALVAANQEDNEPRDPS